MKTALLALLLNAPAWALSNAKVISDLSGSAQTNRTFLLMWALQDKEICDFPQPYIGGAAATYWQATIHSRYAADSRCAAGYVRLAWVAFEASITANGSISVDVRQSTNACHLGSAATCTAAGLTKSGMLNFDAGGGASWGAKISATTGGITQNRSARTMISNDQYRVLIAGPLVTEVEVREGPQSVQGTPTRTSNFGWQCTANCTPPYASATWVDDPAYYSIRPTFWLRFYSRWQRVETDFVAQQGWLDRFQDQRIESATFYRGGAEDVAVTSIGNAFVLPASSMWWLEGPSLGEATAWSTDPPASKVDHGTKYLIAAGYIAPQDTDKPPSTAAATLEYNAWAATDQGVTTNASRSPHLGWGLESNKGKTTGGTRPELGLYPRWTAKYMATWDASLWKVVVNEARVAMRFPMTFLEPDATKAFGTGQPNTGFGRPVSVESGRTFSSAYRLYTADVDAPKSPSGNKISTSCAAPACMAVMVDCTTTHWCSTTTNAEATNGFFLDRAHQTEAFYVPWLATGKPVFYEALTMLGAWSATSGYSDSPPINSDSRWGTKGYIIDTGWAIRAMAWARRGLGYAALAAPDGSIEKTYFSRIVENNFAIDEGRYNILNGSFPPPSQTPPYGCTQNASTETNLWCMGRYFYEAGHGPNPLGFPSWRGGTSGYGLDGRYVGAFDSPWMTTYAVIVYGQLKSLGFKTGPVFEKLANYLASAMADSNGMGASGIKYHWGQSNTAGTAYVTSLSSMTQGSLPVLVLSKPMTPSDSSAYVACFQCLNLSQNWSHPDLQEKVAQYFRIGSEVVRAYAGASYTNAAVVIDPASDRLTAAGHPYSTGHAVLLVRGGSALGPDLSINANPSNCYGVGSKNACVVYLTVLDANTVEAHWDAARTQKVDFSAADTGVSLNWSELQLGNSSGGINLTCGGGAQTLCRGQHGTAAVAHNPGEAVTLLSSGVGWNNSANAVFGYFWNFRGALAMAALHDVRFADSGTGRRITVRRAFEQIEVSGYHLNFSGGEPNCSGLSVDTCGIKHWAFVPYREPKNVRVSSTSSSARLLYTAPTGHACKVALAAGAFPSSDDSSDAADGGGALARSVTVSGLAGGTAYRYRISCPQGRVYGTISTQ